MEYNLTNGSMSGVSSPYDIVTTATSDDCGQLCDVLRAKLGKDCYSYEWMPQCKTSVDKFDGSLGGKKFALSPGYLILQSLMKKVLFECFDLLVPEFRKNYFLNNGHNSCKEMGTSEKGSVRLLVGNAHWKSFFMSAQTCWKKFWVA